MFKSLFYYQPLAQGLGNSRMNDTLSFGLFSHMHILGTCPSTDVSPWLLTCFSWSCALLLSITASFTLGQHLIWFGSTPKGQGLLSPSLWFDTTLVMFSVSVALKRIYFCYPSLLLSPKPPSPAAGVNRIHQGTRFLKGATRGEIVTRGPQR